MVSISFFKACSNCKQLKTIRDFNNHKCNPDGLDYYCRECDRERHKRYYRENSEAICERQSSWAKRNRDKATRNFNNWKVNNPDRWHELRTRNDAKRRSGELGTYTFKEWKDLCRLYGYKCLCCGEVKPKLEADHVIPLSRGGKNSIDNIQPLCVGCNRRKNTKTIDYRYKDNATV